MGVSVVNIKLIVFFEAAADIVKLVDLLFDLTFLPFEYFLQVLSVLLLFFLDQFLKLSELLSDQLLMDFISLLNSAFIALADADILVDFLHFVLGLALERHVDLRYCRQGIRQRTHVVIFLLLHVFVHTLHAHYCSFLLAVEHQGLLMGTTFHLQCLSPASVACSGIVLPLAPSFLHLGGPSLCVDTAPSLSVGHLAESTFADAVLLKLILAEFGTFHVDKEQFFIFFVNKILNVQSYGVLTAGRATDLKFSVQRTDSLGDFQLLCALQTHLVLACQLHHRLALLLTIQTNCRHYLLNNNQFKANFSNHSSKTAAESSSSKSTAPETSSESSLERVWRHITSSFWMIKGPSQGGPMLVETNEVFIWVVEALVVHRTVEWVNRVVSGPRR